MKEKILKGVIAILVIVVIVLGGMIVLKEKKSDGKDNRKKNVQDGLEFIGEITDSDLSSGDKIPLDGEGMIQKIDPVR